MYDFPVKGEGNMAVLYDIFKDIAFPHDFERYSYPNEDALTEAIATLNSIGFIAKKPPREGRTSSGRKKIICEDCGYEITSRGIEALQKVGFK
ncbi:MAG: hypothetical protein VB115_16600 [Christensenellaceae bacterium]|nr:hypothetical protein [Christensenellaceae bacterium]